jgi:hypothetical protein
VLSDTASSYYSKDFSILLQGSYGNDTNVYRDSDVDIVIRLNQTYYSDTNFLTPDAKTKLRKGIQPGDVCVYRLQGGCPCLAAEEVRCRCKAREKSDLHQGERQSA